MGTKLHTKQWNFLLVYDHKNIIKYENVFIVSHRSQNLNYNCNYALIFTMHKDSVEC